MAKLTKEAAVVYRANGRRWFTLDAACRAEGRAILATWFKQAQADWETVPAELMARYWRAVDYLAGRAKRRTLATRPAKENDHG